jgi:hypothetical protein
VTGLDLHAVKICDGKDYDTVVGDSELTGTPAPGDFYFSDSIRFTNMHIE